MDYPGFKPKKKIEKNSKGTIYNYINLSFANRL